MARDLPACPGILFDGSGSVLELWQRAGPVYYLLEPAQLRIEYEAPRVWIASIVVD